MCLDCQADGAALDRLNKKVDDACNPPLTLPLFHLIHLIIILTEGE